MFKDSENVTSHATKNPLRQTGYSGGLVALAIVSTLLYMLY